jgi:hypothetical protein
LNPKCAKKDCITNPCTNQRPPSEVDGFCVDYDNGTLRAGIPQKAKIVQNEREKVET